MAKQMNMATRLTAPTFIKVHEYPGDSGFVLVNLEEVVQITVDPDQEYSIILMKDGEMLNVVEVIDVATEFEALGLPSNCVFTTIAR